MNNKNYYECLGVDINCTTDDIKRAYRRLSLIYHPDKNSNSPDKAMQFKILNQAYSTLSNTIERDKYNKDNNIKSDIQETTNNQLSNNSINNTDSFNNIDNQFKSNIDNNCFRMDYIHPNNLYFNHHYNPYSNQHYNQHYNLPKPVEIIKEINFYQSYNGDNIPISITRKITIQNENYVENETIYVDIQPGIDNNEIITIKEKGNIINNICGDIKVKIILLNDINYKREGLNILYTKNITFKESICGFTFNLKHINGKSYTINNNTGVIINPNYTTTISKMGFQKAEKIGNLIIKYDIEYPEKLDKSIINTLRNIL